MIIKRVELNQKYNLSKNMWDRRHDDLLDWLNDFFPIKERVEKGRYYYEVPDELPESVPRLPRKLNSKQKQEDYEQYVIEHLPKKPTPLSKAKMSRDAIKDFGKAKYKHTSARAVSNRYVGPAMEEHGEHSKNMVWVNMDTYKLLTQEQEEYLHECFAEKHLTELEMANAFKRYAQHEDISTEIDSYNDAVLKFKQTYGFRPISVYEWQAKIM